MNLSALQENFKQTAFVYKENLLKKIKNIYEEKEDVKNVLLKNEKVLFDIEKDVFDFEECIITAIYCILEKSPFIDTEFIFDDEFLDNFVKTVYDKINFSNLLQSNSLEFSEKSLVIKTLVLANKKQKSFWTSTSGSQKLFDDYITKIEIKIYKDFFLEAKKWISKRKSMMLDIEKYVNDNLNKLNVQQMTA